VLTDHKFALMAKLHVQGISYTQIAEKFEAKRR
jgi:hypothetical protein